jgi:hypothetical protein
MRCPPPAISSPHGAEIDPADRTARALADPIGQRDDAGRHAETLLEAARDDADHAGMPILLGDEDASAVGAGVGHRRRFGQNLVLDGTALAVEVVELCRDLGSLAAVLGREQPRPEFGFADPAAGVDPGP